MVSRSSDEARKDEQNEQLLTVVTTVATGEHVKTTVIGTKTVMMMVSFENA